MTKIIIPLFKKRTKENPFIILSFICNVKMGNKNLEEFWITCINGWFACKRVKGLKNRTRVDVLLESFGKEEMNSHNDIEIRLIHRNTTHIQQNNG